MSKATPLIIGYLADRATMSQVESAAGSLGVVVEWVVSAEIYGATDRHDQPGEPVSAGQSATLTAELSAKQPNLLIFDLDCDTIPAQHWIAVVKSSPATRRLPILAYGVEGSFSAEAIQRAGADVVVSKAQLARKLPDLFQKHAKQIDYAAILTACTQPLSEKAKQGITLFNAGEYYEAHHGLEDAWRDDAGPTRELYRGILQVAVAYLQIERGNYRGAVKMFLRVRQWLDPLPDVCHGVNIAQLRTDSQAAQAHLTELGPDQIAQFDQSYFKPIQLV